MSNSLEAKRAAFRGLHESGCFVIATPKNEVGLRRVEKLGAKAIETSVAGFCGWKHCTDSGLFRQKRLPNLFQVCAATDIPVSADLLDPLVEDLQDSVDAATAAIGAGVAGVTISDRDGNRFCPPNLFMERIHAIRETIRESGQDIVLQARCEAIQARPSNLESILYQLQAYSAAGADVIGLPGVMDPSLIGTLVEVVSPKAVSVVVQDWTADVTSMANLGVRRIRMGLPHGTELWSGFDSGFAGATWQAVASTFQTLH